MKNSIFLFVFLFQTSLFWAQTMGLQTLDQLTESPAGQHIVKFVNLVNSGEDVSEAKIKSVFSEGVIEKHSADRLIEIIADVRGQDGQLELYDADRTEKFEYETQLKGLKSGEWIKIKFSLEDKPPFKIAGISIQNSNKNPKAKSPMIAPGKLIDFKARKVNYASFNDISNKADELAKIYQDMNWFEGVVLVAKDGEPFYEKAFGYADRENKIKNTTQTKFRIGSINKSFTMTLIMQMAEKGILSYEDNLSKFDLGFPEKTASTVTVRDLLNHTSGFGDIFIPEYTNNIRSYKNIDDIMPLLKNEPLMFKPGTDEQYSNYNYIVLGAILEKITGKSFGEILQKNILDKIGMKDTHYNIAENIEGESKSYRFNLDGTKTDYTSQLEYCTPDGGMYSTASDLLKYYQNFLYTENLVSNQSKVAFANRFQNSKGDWNKILNEAGGAFGDAGGGPGVSALVEMIWKDNYMLVVLANSDNQIAEELGLRLMNFIQGRSYRKPRLPASHFVFSSIKKHGTDHFAQNGKEMMKKEGYGVNPMTLNAVGYNLMGNNQLDKAIEVFKINVDFYPDEANPYDSLAEAYYKKGDYENARKYYQKALDIDPKFPSAKKMMKELKGK